MDAKQVVLMLLDVLPDTTTKTHDSWKWCWNELFDDAQEEVKEARRVAEQWLASQAEDGMKAE